MKPVALVLLAGGITAFSIPYSDVRVPQVAASCLTNTDTSVRWRTLLREVIEDSDSAELVAMGLVKVDTTLVMVVADTLICTPAVAAYKTATHDTTLGLTRAYVLAAGSSRLFVLHPNRGAGEFRTAIVLDASNYAFLAWLEW